MFSTPVTWLSRASRDRQFAVVKIQIPPALLKIAIDHKEPGKNK